MSRAIALCLLLALAACATATRDPGGYGRAVLLEPIDQNVGVNVVHALPGTPLTAAHVDGRPALCTETAAYFAMGEVRRVCFFDDHGTGALDEGWVMNTLAASSFSLVAPARYRITH